jgi:hypothetical protein
MTVLFLSLSIIHEHQASNHCSGSTLNASFLLSANIITSTPVMWNERTPTLQTVIPLLFPGVEKTKVSRLSGVIINKKVTCNDIKQFRSSFSQSLYFHSNLT